MERQHRIQKIPAADALRQTKKKKALSTMSCSPLAMNSRSLAYLVFLCCPGAGSC